MNILEPALIAGANAMLLTGEDHHLDPIRSQLDLLWSLGRQEADGFKVPTRHSDDGWHRYARPDLRLYIHLYFMSQAR